jgi:ubiquinone/menaquinone biosynthesis C-methylase UbiE
MSNPPPAFHTRATVGVEGLLAGLEAAGEITRLRLLNLLCGAELTVSELVAILGQSQPRISRHLKLLVEAGLAERQREGAWAFFRLADQGGAFVRDLIARLDPSDPVLVADRARLDMTREARRRQAAAYFAQRATDWDNIRALHAPEERVEAAIMAMVGDKPIRALLDLGTGTGRMLELVAPLAERAVGVDQSPAMLALARSRIDQSGLHNAQLRQGDIYAPPVERDSYDLVIIHQVLHFLDDPGRALAEAARALRPGGRLLLVDFAAHDEEILRQDYAHRRLGFTQIEIEASLNEAGLAVVQSHAIIPTPGQSANLTVAIWLAQDRRILTAESPPQTPTRYTVEIV